MRALIVSNMAPTRALPGRGIFVRDQVAALRDTTDVDLELFEFNPGMMSYPLAAARLRAAYGQDGFDVVHAHYGLTAWPSLAVPAKVHAVTLHGTDLHHPRTKRLTLAVLGRLDLVATASEALARELPDSLNPTVLPCGIDLERFRRIPREVARLALGVDPDVPHLLFPSDPARAVKRFDRARELAGDVSLLTLGATDPLHVVLAINAANAVLVPSQSEGFGLAAIEALACDVPVLATPVGAHAEVLDGIDGTFCAPWDLERWRAALAPHLETSDPRVDGRARAEQYSARAMARRVLVAWRELL